MSWALPYVAKLQAGETIQFRPRGNSMKGRIESGQLVTLEPINKATEIKKNDAVLCKVKGKYYLHLVTAIDGQRLQISNMHGFVNGWTTRKQVYGKLIKVEP